MKKLPDKGDRSEHLYRVRLVMDDLEKVVDTLKADGLRVTISDGEEYEYETLSELASKRGQRPRRLRIAGVAEHHSATVNIEIKDGGVHLFGFSTGDTGVPRSWYEVREVFRGKSPRWGFLVSPMLWFVLWPCLSIVISIIVAWDKQVTWTEAVVAFSLMAACGLAWCFAGAAQRQVFGAFLRARHEGGAINKHGRDLLLIAAGAVIGKVVDLLFRLISSP